MNKGDSGINQDITNFPSFNLSAVNKEEEFLLSERDLADKNFLIYTLFSYGLLQKKAAQRGKWFQT